MVELLFTMLGSKFVELDDELLSDVKQQYCWKSSPSGDAKSSSIEAKKPQGSKDINGSSIPSSHNHEDGESAMNQLVFFLVANPCAAEVPMRRKLEHFTLNLKL